MKCLFALLLVTFVITVKADDTTPDAVPPGSSRKDITYEKDIKPIFEKSCVKCHGAEKPKAKLRLDSLEGVMKGGENGKVVHPGDSTGSILVKTVAHTIEEDLWMPPVKNKLGIKPLTREQISLIRTWIDQGAK